MNLDFPRAMPWAKGFCPFRAVSQGVSQARLFVEIAMTGFLVIK